MLSEVDNLKNILIHYFNIQPTDIFLALSIAFIMIVAYYGLQSSIWQGLANSFVAMTFCTLLGFIPPHLYGIMCILLAAIIAGKFFDFGGK